MDIFGTAPFVGVIEHEKLAYTNVFCMRKNSNRARVAGGVSHCGACPHGL